MEKNFSPDEKYEALLAFTTSLTMLLIRSNLLPKGAIVAQLEQFRTNTASHSCPRSAEAIASLIEMVASIPET